MAEARGVVHDHPSSNHGFTSPSNDRVTGESGLTGSEHEPSVEAFEQRGYFVHIPFEDEDNPTVLYVAHKDFASLQSMIENPDPGWEEFRDEIFSLLEHSGHEEEHTLPESTTRTLMELVEAEDLPDEATIDDPLEDLESGD